ncbi:FtsX-like permease family protein [Pollutibacter soli]|uniref:FtsX-like permease family protein n=1 Tax=Pollutibacter soli TaxID=3034157 RepID=UPI00301359DD
MIRPPAKASAFLRWFCREDCIEEVEGDLIEIFDKEAIQFPQRARWKFVWSVIKHFRPEYIKPLGKFNLKTIAVHKTYFTIGWRNLLRQKGYSAINIGGLAIGMMVAILNGLWIFHELSYNQYFENYDRVAQVAESGIRQENGEPYLATTMTFPLSTALRENYNQHFKHVVRTTFSMEKILTAGDTKILSAGLSADPEIAEMLTLKMIRGNRKALEPMHSIILSKSIAIALFGDADPINKTVRLNNSSDVKVTGVYEDFPGNTTFSDVKFFTPWSLFVTENKWIQQRALTDWRNHFLRIYVEVPEDQTYDVVSGKIRNALHFAPEDIEQRKKENAALTLYPMSDWHLHPTYVRQGQMQPLLMIKLVGAIGAFVLFLACINFINLSTARAEKRAREIGVRKTIGSDRSRLITQFFTESFLIVVLSFAVSLMLTILILPLFNKITTDQVRIPFTSAWFWVSVILIIFITSLLAGFYPAIYLSSFNPIRALKGSLKTGKITSIPRKVLVVFQFSISVILIIGTAVVYRQIQYAKDRPVGYDRNGLIMVHKRTDDFTGKYQILRDELKKTGTVYEVSESMGPATQMYSNNNGWQWGNHEPNWDQSFGTLAVSALHGKTIGWEFIQGRDFDPAILTDSSGIVINESALKFMGLENPIGEPVSWYWWTDKSRVLNYKILGVIKDPVMESPYGSTEPAIFFLKGHNGSTSWINIKIDPKVSMSKALPVVEKVFKNIVPAVPFEYEFADEEYARKFGKEETIGNLATFFAILAVLISCLGVLGLASYMAETRVKEIGIRKVLGASVAGLWRLLSVDFVWLVLIACLISAPVAYLLMNQWLQKFEYRTGISWWLFVETAVCATAITLITISYQAIKTARLNPVKTLRSE